MERAMSPLSPVLRLGLAGALLVCSLVLLLRFVGSVGGEAGLWVPVAHALLAVLTALAALGLWAEAPWTPLALIVLGCTFAATRLVEAFVLGIRPWLFALLAAAGALIASLVLAAWVRPRTHQPGGIEPRTRSRASMSPPTR
jgi:hypothetical protein